MPLPLTRDKTYAATDHVNLSHATHWQDIVRMLWRGQHGQRVMNVQAMHSSRDTWELDKSANFGVDHRSGGTARMKVPVELPAGTLLESVTIGWNPATVAAGITATLRSMSLADATLSDHGSVVSGSTAYHTSTIGLTPDVLMASDRAYFVQIISTDINSVVGGVRFTYSRPGRITPP